MPKIVDREARRREIVEAYLRVVARQGMAGATTRALATELGVASGALWHYFANFDEVLAAALELVFARTGDRIEQARDGARGLEALLAVLAELFPRTPEAVVEAYVLVSFWGRATSNVDVEPYGAAQAQLSVVLTALLDEAVREGELRPPTPTAGIAEVLMTLTTGAQVDCVLGTERGRADHHLRLVVECLSPWLADDAARAALTWPGALTARSPRI